MEEITWDISLVDLISPYKIIGLGHHSSLILKLLTMILPATGWFYIINYKDKQADTIES